MSQKKEQEYFSDGLSEELIDHLAHAQGLKVIARTSSFQFKGRNEDVRSIAAKLGVANLLEGSVRTAAGQMRIAAQLIRASDGTHLWSQTYDRNVSDIFKVQDEIAERVAQALSATLVGGPAKADGAQSNTAAYELLLKGNFFYERNHAGDGLRAIERYQQALAIDPNYALAWAKLGRVYISQGGSADIPAAEAESKGRVALQRALALDPDSVPAHRWLGRIYLNYRWDWAAARSEFERAIALDPTGTEGELTRADLETLTALTTGQFKDAIRHGQEMQARNPLDTNGLSFMGWFCALGGQPQEAAVYQRRLLELDPDFAGVHSEASWTWLLMGKNPEALAEAQQETDEESRLQNLARVYWAMGRRRDADMALSQLERKFADSAAYDIGSVYAYRGDKGCRSHLAGTGVPTT